MNDPMNLQEAVDAPRIRHMDGMEVYLEDGISGETILELQKKGASYCLGPGIG